MLSKAIVVTFILMIPLGYSIGKHLALNVLASEFKKMFDGKATGDSKTLGIVFLCWLTLEMILGYQVWAILS